MVSVWEGRGSDWEVWSGIVGEDGEGAIGLDEGHNLVEGVYGVVHLIWNTGG